MIVEALIIAIIFPLMFHVSKWLTRGVFIFLVFYFLQKKKDEIRENKEND